MALQLRSQMVVIMDGQELQLVTRWETYYFIQMEAIFMTEIIIPLLMVMDFMDGHLRKAP